jgi:hypothetical protein
MAYRGLISAERLAWASELKDPALWLGAGRSFLLYPVAGGRLINMVAFVPTDTEAEESWSASGDVKALAAEYAGWDKPVQDTINSLDETFRWGIYDRAPLPYWSTGHITLMGDAAHPMVPHVGQGAGQSIEDAITLAVLLESARPLTSPAASSSTRRSGWRGPVASKRSRAPLANSIAPSTTILRRRQSACENGWRREGGCSSTMRKRWPGMRCPVRATEKSIDQKGAGRATCMKE